MYVCSWQKWVHKEGWTQKIEEGFSKCLCHICKLLQQQLADKSDELLSSRRVWDHEKVRRDFRSVWTRYCLGLSTPSLSQWNINVFNPGQCATMAEQHTHRVHLSDTTVVQLAAEIPKDTNNLMHLNNKYFWSRRAVLLVVSLRVFTVLKKGEKKKDRLFLLTHIPQNICWQHGWLPAQVQLWAVSSWSSLPSP